MAKLFISYIDADAEIAQRVEQCLLDKGHRIGIPVGAAIVGSVRATYARSLAASDVVLVVMSDAALKSRRTIEDIGAAHALQCIKGMLVLPVLIGEISAPDFVSDLFYFRLKSESEPDLTKLANQLHKAIVENVKPAPRIFISHRHADEPIAAALVALLEHAFHIERSDIRCTSVKPYMLSPGEKQSEQLRSDIANCELVIGILGPDTAESNYVLCELGASWGRAIPTFPVLTRGATADAVPPPLNERQSISLENIENCLALVAEVARKTSLKPRDSGPGKLARQTRALADVASLPRPAKTGGPMLTAQFMGDDAFPGRNGRWKVRLGISGCPNDTIQIVFCANDEGLTTGTLPLENELCQVVQEAPVDGKILAADDEYWSISGDSRFYAIGIRGDAAGSFTASAGLCEAIENHYSLFGKRTVPRDVKGAIRELIENRVA